MSVHVYESMIGVEVNQRGGSVQDDSRGLITFRPLSSSEYVLYSVNT